MPKGTSRFILAALMLVSSVSIFLQFEVIPANATTVSWSSSQNVPAGNWFSVEFGNGRWVAVAQGGTNRLMTSTDGATWTTEGLTFNGVAGGPVDGDWRAIRYANNMWLAAGFDGRVMTSSDGLAWSSVGVTGLSANEDFNSVAYKSGAWVAVGSASTVMRSVDGLTWTNSGVTGVPSAINLRSIVWASSFSRFVAVGDNSTVIYSADGITWSNANVTGIATAPGFVLDSVASGVASDGNHRIVVVSSVNTFGNIWSSTNGETWTAGTANTSCTSSQRWKAVGFGNGRWIAARGGSGVCNSISSILGIHQLWEQPSGGVAVSWNGVAYGNGRWVAVGNSASMSAAEPSLTPALDTPVATADGFTVNVTNYNASYFWGSAPTVSAGTATWGTASGATRPLTVTGLSVGALATVTVTATRSGFSPGSASATGNSLAPVRTLTPATQTISGTSGSAITSSAAFTASGFSGALTYTVTNGSLPTGLQLDPSTGVVSGNPSGSSSASVTITGSSSAEIATATISFSIIEPSPTPTFGLVTSTADGFTVNVTNYDGAFTWTPSADTGSISAGTASGSTLPLTVTGLSAGVSTTITVSTSRSGYANSSASKNGSALSAATTTTTTIPTTTTTTTTTTSPTTTTTTTTIPTTTTTTTTGPITTTTTTSTSTSTSPMATTTVPAGLLVATGPSTTTTTQVPRPTRVPSPVSGQLPSFVSAGDAVIAGRQPGQVAAIVNGQNVAAIVGRIVIPAVSIPLADRTAEQISGVQRAAATLIAEFKSSLPQNVRAPVSIANTATGAVVNGLLVNTRNGVSAVPVPIENIVMMTVGSAKLLLVGALPNGDPLSLRDGILLVGPGGILSVAMVGLPTNAPSEAVLFSTPTLLGSFTTSADGTFSGQFTVPFGIESGAHSLLLKMGDSTVSIGVRVDSSLTMPSTGVGVNSYFVLVMLLLATGALTRMVGRRISYEM